MSAVVLTMLFYIFSPVSVFAAPVKASLVYGGDTVHLELEGREQWDYNVERKDQGPKSFVQITVPAINEKNISSLKSFTSPIVKSVAVDAKGPDGNFVLTFELVGKNVDTFDYLTEKPSRLIIDFFKNSQNAEPKKVATKLPPKKVAKADEAEEEDVPAELPGAELRKPANDVLIVNPQGGVEVALNEKADSQAGIYDGADPSYGRFSIKDYEVKDDAIIASRENVYVDFPMLKKASPYLPQLASRKPVYEITPKDSDENKQARLLQTLFENKRYHVFLKTLDWFLKKYPNSEYDEIVRFMWADTLFALWMEKRDPNDFDLAMLRYRQAIEKYPQSALVERTLMLMGFATLDRGDYLGTLRQFQNHIRNRPDSPNKDIARLAVAEAFVKINKYDDAIKQLDEIERNASLDKYKVEAQFNKGDTHYLKKDYRSAVEAYQAALKKNPEAASEYPNALYNQAASYFWLGNYRQSLDTYRMFLEKFPSDPHAGFAMTRIGELLEILGADKPKVVGAYLETYFRYGETPSSVVGRLRLLSSRMNTMKPKEVEKAIKDIGDLAEKSDLPKIGQFATLMIAEGRSKRKEYDKAIDLLVKYYQANPTSSDTELLSARIIKNINEQLTDLVDQGKFIEALKLHNKYADNWLKSSDRIDTKYNVARAYEQSGVLNEAEKLYKDTLNRIYSLKGTSGAKERNIFEKLPSTDELNLRLAAIEYQTGKFAQSYESLKKIEKPVALNGKDQIERVQLFANLLEKRGDDQTAIRYLTELLKEWSGIPHLVAEPYLQLAQLEQKMGKFDDAVKSLQHVDQLMTDSEKVDPGTHAKALEMLGNLQLEKKTPDKAVATYEKLLAKYENKRPLGSIRYKVGELYFQKGEIQKAAEVWNELQKPKTEFWYKLAQEQLKNSEFKNEYKKYIQRIPAMSERK